MIVLAPFISNTVQDQRFVARGAPNHHQGPTSTLPILVKPMEYQTAYFGYKENIDVFLAATATGSTLSVQTPHFVIPELDWNVPITLPDMLVSFDLDKGILAKFVESASKSPTVKVTKVDGIRKHAQLFRISGAPLTMINRLKLLKRRKDTPRIGGTIPIEGLHVLKTCIDFLELYLRTNTYPAFKSDDTKNGQGKVVINGAKRVAMDFGDIRRAAKKAKYSDGIEVTSGSKKENGFWFGEKTDAEIEVDMEAAIYDSLDNDLVIHAKPSPAKSSNISFGLPKDCPELPGIIFPYFPGMLAPDNNIIRTTIGDLFFRCLGPDPREAFSNFRKDVGMLGSTSAGIELSHIFQGVKISLEAQGQLYLMFDGAVYLGFVVLGAKWQINVGNVWHSPSTSSELRDALSEIHTHTGSIEAIANMMVEAGIMVDLNDSTTPVGLARAVVRMDFGEELEDETEEQARQKKMRDFMTLLHKLNFPRPKTSFSLITFQDALAAIFDPTISIEDQPVQFPKSFDELYLLSSRVGLVLSRFGVKSPSFVIPKVDKSVSVDIGTLGHKETREGEVEKVLKDLKRVMIAEKPFETAVKDMNRFLQSPVFVDSSKERAAGYRHHVFTGPSEIRKLVECVVLGMPAVVSFGGSGSKKGKGKATEAATGDLEDMDFDDLFT